MRTVFSYSDYRSFLKDFYEFQKQRREYSYKAFSIEAGLKSPNYLKLVIDGAKNLTLENIHNFAKALKLSWEETHYFEVLVNCNQAKSQEVRSYYEKIIAKLRGSTPQNQKKIHHQQAFLSHPYIPAIICVAPGLKINSAIDSIHERIRIDSRAGVCDCRCRDGTALRS